MVFFRFLPILFCKWSFFAHISNLFRHDFFPEKGHTENSGRRRMASHLFLIDICLFPNSVSFGVFSHSKGLRATSSSGVSWGRFRWPRKRFSGFCGRFPQLFFTFVSQSSPQKVLWKVPPTLLCICLPVFSGYVEGSPDSSVHLSSNFLCEKGSVEGPPQLFRQLR